MAHRETKKETKMQNKKSSKPNITHNDEIKKTFPKGVIKGIE
jgi:hypothetical protein